MIPSSVEEVSAAVGALTKLMEEKLAQLTAPERRLVLAAVEPFIHLRLSLNRIKVFSGTVEGIEFSSVLRDIDSVGATLRSEVSAASLEEHVSRVWILVGQIDAIEPANRRRLSHLSHNKI